VREGLQREARGPERVQDVTEALRRVSERALRAGAQAGLEALAASALQLSGASGVLLQEGRRPLCRAGLLPPSPREKAGVERLTLGRLQLLLRVPALVPPQREPLERLLQLLPALLAAREREQQGRAAQARLRCEARAQAERAQRLDTRRSRASHDLRTPLVVMKGYVDMIQRGLAGPLSPALQRYAERLARAVDEQNGLIARHLSADRGPTAPLVPALRAALARTQRPGTPRVTLHTPASSPTLRAERAQLSLLARTLVDALRAGHVGSAELHVLGPEAAGPCQLRLVLPTGTTLADSGALEHLGALARALSGQLERTAEGLSLLLPAAV
jgi:two-component system, OmpR family, sensor kinase